MSAKDAQTDLDAGVLNNSEWVKRWGVGDTAFHQGAHDPLFDTHGDMMFEGGAKSVFAPLCGKSLDLIWMYNRGHTVVGAEIAEQAVQELFSENKLDVHVQHVEGVGPLYKSTDGRLQVYVGDLFDLTKDRLCEFDRVWDSKSIVAINVVDQERYRDLLLSFLKKDGQYYLITIDYDPAVWPGPPHNITDQRVRQLYGVDVVLAVRTDSAPTPAASSRFVKNCSVPPLSRPCQPFWSIVSTAIFANRLIKELRAVFSYRQMHVHVLLCNH